MSDKDWQALIDTLRDGDASQLAAAASRLHKTATSVDLPRLMSLLNDNDGFTAALLDLVETNKPASRKILEGLKGDPAMRELALWLLEFCS
jgi:hypothetical protein